MEEIHVRVFEFGNRRQYQLQWNDPITGRKKTKSSGVLRPDDPTDEKAVAKARKAAEKEAGKLEAELREGRYQNPSRITWEAFKTRCLEEKGPEVSLSYLPKIEAVFAIVDSVLSPGRLRDLTTERVAHLAREMKARGFSDSSRHSYLATLKAALRWAVKFKMLPCCPDFDMPRAGKSKGRPIVAEEYERILAAVPKVVGEALAASWQRFITGLWLSGLRLSEALALSWDENAAMAVDLSGKHPRLRIDGKAQKSGKDELLPLTPDFAEFLLQMPEAERTGRVFRPAARRGNHVAAKHTVIETMRQISKRAGVRVTAGKYATAHDFRRSFGTRWAKRVMPAVLKRLMRHADIQTTMTYYVALDADELAADLWREHGPQRGNNRGNSGSELPGFSTANSDSNPLRGK